MTFYLPAGTYVTHVRNNDSPPWDLEAPVTVEADRFTDLVLTFNFLDLRVETIPPGAKVSWKPEINEFKDGPTTAVTPFTHGFKTGKIQFTIEEKSYNTVITNYCFYPKTKDYGPFIVALPKASVPRPGEEYINSS